MSSRKRESTRRDRRRQAFRDAALGIVLAEGLDALTIARLARELGSAVGAVYRYYPGKEALVLDLQLLAVQRFAAFLDQRLDGHDEDPVRPVLRALTAWSAFALAAPSLHALIDASLSAPRAVLEPGGADEVQQALEPVLARVTALIERAQQQAALSAGDASLRTRVAWALVHGVGQLRKVDPRTPEGMRSDRVLRAGLLDLLAGWGASRSRVSDLIDGLPLEPLDS